jgi:hypothetical protein
MIDHNAIRNILMKHGFTIKEGQTDIKPYVYAAAHELIGLARATPQHSVTEQALRNVDAVLEHCQRHHAHVNGTRNATGIARATVASLAQPLESTAATQPEQASIDTPEFRNLLFCFLNASLSKGSREKAQAALIAHIDSRVALAIPAFTATTQQEQGGTGCDKCDEGWVYKPCPYCTIPASTAASKQQASVSELPGLEYRTCCDHPDCTTCAGHGGFYRIAALSGRATIPSEADEQASIDLDKLDRYGFDGTMGGDFGRNSDGPYVVLDDLRAALTHRATTATYTVDGVVMSPLEYIDHLHTKLGATTAADQQGAAYSTFPNGEHAQQGAAQAQAGDDAALERAAEVAERFGPSRPIITKRPSERIQGRWEGEQAASSAIAVLIRDMKSKRAAMAAPATSKPLSVSK